MAGLIRRVGRRRERSESVKEDFSERLVTILDPTGAASEAYRILRANLLYAFVDNPPKVLTLTSPGPREGKSTVCANLGVTLAQAGKSTLILDCDLRRPTIHRIFKMRNLRGLASACAGEHGLQKISQQSQVPGLKVVTAGPIMPNPAELLDSGSFVELLRLAREEFDYVLLDTPPIGLFSDPLVLATRGDGVLLVVDAQNTRKKSVRQTVRNLEAVGANILGTVMSNAEVPKNPAYYHYNG